MTAKKAAKQPGTVITFYSYKGGTGRSMALANCAVLAARTLKPGERALMIDWDLEAPGLHRYFPVAEQEEETNRPGIIDYFNKLAHILSPDVYKKLSGQNGGDELDGFEGSLFLRDYIVSNVADRLDLIKAGALTRDYSDRIANFDWAEMFRRYPRVYRAFRLQITSLYRYCFIDSRTGLSDISGVSTMIMPEKLALVFTPNRQSLDGVIELGTAAVEYRRNSDDPRPLAVFPLPSRVVTEEHKLLQGAQEHYRNRFEDFFRMSYGLDKCNLTPYFKEVALPHKGFYGFQELIAVRDDMETEDALSINRAYERFFERLMVLDSAWDEVPGTVMQEAASRHGPPIAASGTAVAKGFENDVYISYAHLDDAPYGGQDGFVSRLHADLSTRLAQKVGKPVRIWKDSKSLIAGELWSDSNKSALESSAAALLVVSPAYMNSEWCRREMQLALESVARRPSLQILTVYRASMDRDLLPQELQDRLGYNFFRTDEGGRSRDLLLDGASNSEYWLRVDDLAHDLAEILLGKRTGDAAKAERVIYLAQTTADLQDRRDQLRRELLDRGHRVAPESPLPLQANELRMTLDREMARAELSIHLISSVTSLVPEGATESISELQLSAAARARLRSVIWVPRGSNSPDWLSKQTREQTTDMVGSGFEELRTVVLDALKKQLRYATTPALPQIFLICDERDRAPALDLQSWIAEQGFSVVLPPVEGSPAEIREDRIQTMRLADGTVVYWQSGAEAWVRTIFRDFREARGGKRCLLYIPDATTAAKQQFKSHEVDVIRNATREGLGRFLEKIRETVMR